MKYFSITENEKEIRCIEFEDLQEEKKYIEEPIKNNKWEIIDEIRDNSRRDFFGGSTLEETLQALDYGLKSYTDYFLENINEYTKTTNEDNGLYMDIEGFAYDMGSVVEGVPECCITAGMPTPVPIIKIMVDITFAGCVEAKIIMNRGVAITNLINTLLAKKNIVELSFVDFNTQCDMNTLIKTNVDTTTLPISTIAMLCSPQFFRQVSWIATDELRQKESTLGRGRSEMLKCIAKKIEEENILFIGGSYTDPLGVDYGRYDSIAEANKYITELYNNFCVKQEGGIPENEVGEG